jgi:hypothetical protein
MLTAFAAMFSTVLSVMDGFPRAFSTILRTLFPGAAFFQRSGNPTYWLFMTAIFAYSVAINTLIQNPVLMIQIVGQVSLTIAPILYSLNYYCVTRLAPAEVRPSQAMRIWALFGIAFMAAAAGFSLYLQIAR